MIGGEICLRTEEYSPLWALGYAISVISLFLSVYYVYKLQKCYKKLEQ